MIAEEIRTKQFRLGHSVHARLAFARRSATFWGAVALPLIVLVVAGFFYDTRLLIVSAAIIFIVIPTILLITWLMLLSQPWVVASIFPQVVTLNSDNEIVVEYSPLPNADGEDKVGRMPQTLLIPAARVDDCRVWGDYIDVSYMDNRELLVPLTAFADIGASIAFMTRLQR